MLCTETVLYWNFAAVQRGTGEDAEGVREGEEVKFG